jgi:hypothetical protein
MAMKSAESVYRNLDQLPALLLACRSRRWSDCIGRFIKCFK